MRRGACGRKKVGVAGKRRGDDGWKRNENGTRKPKRLDSGWRDNDGIERRRRDVEKSWRSIRARAANEPEGRGRKGIREVQSMDSILLYPRYV
jgi:hypothetical protein